MQSYSSSYKTYPMRQFRYNLLILLAAFTLQAIIPFFTVYDSPAHAQPALSLFGEKILLCTGDGFKWVNWSDLKNGKEKPHKPGDKCPLCYAARHIADLAPDSGLTLRIQPVALILPLLQSPLTLLSSASPLNMRAPPLSFHN